MRLVMGDSEISRRPLSHTLTGPELRPLCSESEGGVGKRPGAFTAHKDTTHKPPLAARIGSESSGGETCLCPMRAFTSSSQTLQI